MLYSSYDLHFCYAEGFLDYKRAPRLSGGLFVACTTFSAGRHRSADPVRERAQLAEAAVYGALATTFGPVALVRVGIVW